jgi:hypothetical protein
MYACRIGIAAANSRPQTTIIASTPQKLSIVPIRPRVTTLSAARTMRPEVRRRKSRRIRGATSPPRICAPAAIAATSPAIWYACGSPHSSSRYGWRA